MAGTLPHPTEPSFRAGGTARSNLREVAQDITRKIIIPNQAQRKSVRAILDKNHEFTMKCKNFAEIVGEARADDCVFFGRTAVFQRGTCEYGMKALKKGEQSFQSEWRAMRRAQELKQALGLDSDLPSVEDLDHTGVFLITDGIGHDFRVSFEAQAIKGGFELSDSNEVLIYKHPTGYHRYLHEPEISPEELAKSSIAFVSDLGIAADHQVYFPESSDLFHDSTIGQKYYLNADDISWGGGTGQLEYFDRAVANVNIRLTGAADPKKWTGQLPLDFGDDRDPTYHYGQDMVMAIVRRSVLLDNLLSWALSLILSWKCRLEKISGGNQEIEPINLPVMLRNGISVFLQKYIGVKSEVSAPIIDECLPLIPGGPDNLIDFERLDIQIRFFVLGGYVDRAENQPHAVMRKALARLIPYAEGISDRTEHPAYQTFVSKANYALTNDVLSLFSAGAPPDRNTLAQKLLVFCRTFTGMHDGEIFTHLDRVMKEYEATNAADLDALSERFAREISIVRDRVREAGVAETFLAAAQIDYDELKRHCTTQKLRTQEDEAVIVTEENCMEVIGQHLRSFFERYSIALKKNRDGDALRMGEELAQSFRQLADGFAKEFIVGQKVSYQDTLRVFLDIDTRDRFSAFGYPREMFSPSTMGITDPYIVDVSIEDRDYPKTPLVRDDFGYQFKTLPYQYDRWVGTGTGLGLANGINPLIELAVGFQRVVLAAEIAKSYLASPR